MFQLYRGKGESGLRYGNCLESDRQGMVPLIEIPQNFVDKKPSFFETGGFIHRILSEIASCWGDGLAFVDFHALARLSSTNVTRHIETCLRVHAGK